MQPPLTERKYTRRTIPTRECLAVLVRLAPRDAERIRQRARAERIGLGPLIERLALEQLARVSACEDPGAHPTPPPTWPTPVALENTGQPMTA
jgi:hypothetical protein